MNMIRIFFVLALQQVSLSLALSSTSNTFSCSETATSLGLDIPKLRSDLASGRVHHHRNFFSEAQVSALLEQVEQLRESGAFAPSGLSNTNKGKDQNFGEADRTVCPLPWWKDSIAGRHEAAAGDSDKNTSKESANLRISASKKLQDVRLLLSKELNRPTMADADESMAHECYYSWSTEGATLSRHMDERHEETKGARGYLLPSRRSISWLVYLSDADWKLERNGGALRSFPQRLVKNSPGIVETGCHNGNLQVGWLVKDGDESVPVFLDCRHKVVTESGDEEPQCILYIASSEDKDQVEYITQPWMNEGLQGMTVSDFLKVVSESESKAEKTNLFTQCQYARDFKLLEDRALWEAGGDPHGSVPVDIPPERGSLVMFDSVSVPHEVGLVKKGKRVALAGWFHEKTQSLPGDFYGTP